MPSSVLAFGYHDQQAQRHWNIKKRLQQDGHSVVECHTHANGVLRKYWSLTLQYFATQKKCNTVLVCFPGHYLVPLAWLLTRYPRKKLVFDAFISLWDTLVDDRKKYSRWHPMAWFLYAVDWISCHMADEILIDTEAHKQFFVEKFRLPEKKIRVIYLETREDIFFPRTTLPQHASFEILFFGSYIPLQGIEHIVTAAGILESIAPGIHFTLIGSGQTRYAIEQLIRKKNIKNIALENRIPMTELANRIRQCNLCLGIFGTSNKAGRVIPHKVYDAVACAVPVLTADTPAIAERFANHPLVYVCPTGNAAAIASSIQDIRKHLSSNHA